MRTASEFEGVEFGDKRLSKRVVKLAEQLARAPDLSFPKATGSDAALEATYRFLNNEKVTPEAILSAHVRATAERCSQAGTVFIAHDSSELKFSGPRGDIGRLSSDTTHGFLGHFALAVSARGRAPLGVLGFSNHAGGWNWSSRRR
jgi:Transposase DNA-binding